MSCFDQNTNTTSTTSNTVLQNTVTGLQSSDEVTVVKRMQQRRGLKQDLPQPLRPGELGFATDSHQLFIGADPDSAPGYSSVSVYESTLGSHALVDSIMSNQMLTFTLPFKKFSRGELMGSTRSLSWTPSDFTKTGGSEPVFHEEYVRNHSVYDIMTQASFIATRMVVKKNGVRLVGSDGTSAEVLVARDYQFQQTPQSHVLTLRFIPQSNEELTVSYHGGDQQIRWIMDKFHTEYDIPTWLRLNPDLTQYSDTSGRGFLGLEFKHISVQAHGDTLTSPRDLPKLGTLRISRLESSLVPGNITRSQPLDHLIRIPMDQISEFSTTGARSMIWIDSGLNQYTDPTTWLDTNPVPITQVDSDAVWADISINLSTQILGQARASDTTGVIEYDIPDIRGIRVGDRLKFHGSSSGHLRNHTLTVWSVEPGRYGVKFQTTEAVWRSLFDHGNIQFATCVNLGPLGYENVVQFRSGHHGLNALNSTRVWISSSSHNSVLSSGAWHQPRYDLARTTSENQELWLPVNSEVTDVVQCVALPDDPLDYGPDSSYRTQMISVDLSQARTIQDVCALVNAAAGWPHMLVMPDTNNRLVLTQNPAYDSVGQGFVILPDPQGTSESLGFQVGTHSVADHTVRAKLEKWLNSMVGNPDQPFFNTASKLGTHSNFYCAETSDDYGNLSTWNPKISTTFNEIRFDSREEAQAFNRVVNHLYYRQSTSDVKGLLNLKSNLELGIRQYVVTGEKQVTFTNMDGVQIPSDLADQPVPGLVFNIQDFNSWILEYSIHEAPSASGYGAHYSRIGTIHLIARNDMTTGGSVGIMETGTEVLDSAWPHSAAGDGRPSIHWRAIMDQQGNAQIMATNNVNMPLLMKYVVRRWNSDQS